MAFGSKRISLRSSTPASSESSQPEQKEQPADQPSEPKCLSLRSLSPRNISLSKFQRTAQIPTQVSASPASPNLSTQSNTPQSSTPQSKSSGLSAPSSNKASSPILHPPPASWIPTTGRPETAAPTPPPKGWKCCWRWTHAAGVNIDPEFDPREIVHVSPAY